METMRKKKAKKTLKKATQHDVRVGNYHRNAVAELYTTSLTLSGKRIELRRYQRPILKRYVPVKKSAPLPRADREKLYKRRADNKVRARRKLTQLVHQNIPLIPHAKLKPRFYLLTYEDQERGVFNNHEAHMHDLKKFVRKLRHRYPNVKVEYMGAKEKNKRGQAHFHILFTGLPFIEKPLVEKLWSQGFVKIKQVNYGYDNVKHLANYVSKYITKQGDDVAMYHKLYFVSENLKQPLKTNEPGMITQILSEAVHKGYLVQVSEPYEMEFINNAVTYEQWEPI